MKNSIPDTDVFYADTPQTTSEISPGEIIIGSLTGIDAKGQPLVLYPGIPAAQPIAAISTLGLTHQHTGRQVALLFANGDPQKPVIMGLIHSPLHDLLLAQPVAPAISADPITAVLATDPARDLTIDGKRLVIEGKEEIVLKCGEASITLTKAGKILIRGKYLLNRSAGLIRLLGGSVQIN
ncbi:MAG: hypothetical protein CVV05_02355 [Gammaproteobacteria bacterium HGW-Gammaproteobacteria-1]|jgi:hypothetical protein|nr:MAG: hypothetical protein CVV05_02355 [Gammaproteobacteria bacterium HGW-Gammaproteobacteria-1]